MPTKLKPCPFCGSEATAKLPVIIDGKPSCWNYIACKNAKCRIKPFTDWHKCRAVVVREWNRRTGDA